MPRLSHYEILEPLGRGGMGVVHKARDVRLGRTVAIKVLPPLVSADPERRARLMREARAAAALNHPNIAGIYDVGEASGEELAALDSEEYEGLGSTLVPYIVMELVEGRDLRQMLAEHRLPLGETLGLAIQIAEGLAAAHRAGVVHRDLKPANVMVSSDGRPKLLDFGLAKILAEEPSGDGPETLLTREGMIVGTVPYMAPEQLQGERTDARSDLFSFGVVLYEMIAGEPPFPRRLIDFFKAVSEQPEPLSSSCPYIAPELAAVVHRLIARHPDERYQGADEVLHDLRGLAEGSSASHSRPQLDTLPTLHVPGLRARRRRRRAAIAGGLLLAALLFAALAWWVDHRRASRTEPRFNLAVLPFENRTGDPVHDGFSRGLSELVRLKLRRVRGINAIDSELGADRLLSGGVSWLPEGRVAIDLELSAAGEGAEPSSGRVDEERGDVGRLVRAVDAWVLGELEVPLSIGERLELGRPFTTSPDALEHYLRALPYLEERPEANLLKAETHLRDALELDDGFGLAHAQLSDVLWTLFGQFRSKETALIGEAERHALRAVALDDEEPEAQIALAQVYRGRDDFGRAEVLLGRLAWRYPHLAEVHRQLAITYRRSGQYCRARDSSRAALEIQPRLWRHWNEYGLAFFHLGRFDEAQEAFAHAAEVAPASEVTSLMGNRLSALVSLGAYDRAIAVAEEIPEPIESTNLQNSIGAAYSYAGRYTEAQRYYEQAVAAARDGQNPLAQVASLTNLGEVLERQGFEVEARRLYSEALNLFEQAPNLASLERETAPLYEVLLFAKLEECHSAQRRVDEVAAKLPDNSWKHLVLARIFALCGREEHALAQLRGAVRSGVQMRSLHAESDLQPLVDRPEFAALEALEPSPPECP